VEHCEMVTSMDACMRLPACIYCFTGSGYRSLLGSNAHFSPERKWFNGSLATTNKSLFNYTLSTSNQLIGRNRFLFIDIVPFPIISSDADLKGHCVSGWLASSCSSNAANPPLCGFYFWPSITLTLLLLILFVGFI